MTWPAEDVQILKELLKEGKTHKYIANVLDRSHISVMSKVANTGLGSKILVTREIFCNRIKDRNLILIGEYKTTKHKTNFSCLICSNIWETTPAIILGGSSCPCCAKICRRLGWDKDLSVKNHALIIPNELYILENELCLKVGVSYDTHHRCGQIQQDFKVLKVFKTNCWVAYQTERLINSKFKKYNYTVKFDGYTECRHKKDLGEIIKMIEEELNGRLAR